MKYRLILVAPLLLLGACVSKQKYSSLQKQHEQTLNEKSGLEEVLNKVAVENDSLKKQIASLDSLVKAEREKNFLLSNARNSSGTNASKAKNGATISKTAEYDKKALYIYNLPNYVFWPRSIKADKFLIGIIGDSPMNAALGAYVYGKNIQKLPAIVEPYNPAPGKFYHILFVAESRQKDFHKIKKELKGQPILLIAENQYLDNLAHICLFVVGDKVKFSVSKKEIEKAGLNVSDQLIKLGQTAEGQ